MVPRVAVSLRPLSQGLAFRVLANSHLKRSQEMVIWLASDGAKRLAGGERDWLVEHGCHGSRHRCKGWPLDGTGRDWTGRWMTSSHFPKWVMSSALKNLRIVPLVHPSFGTPRYGGLHADYLQREPPTTYLQ